MHFDIPDVSSVWQERAEAYQQQLTKPLGSLDQLEGLAVQLAAIQGTLAPSAEQAAALIFAADHGVADLSAYPAEVTVHMVHNFLNGGAMAAVLAKQHGVTLEVVDVGINHNWDGFQHPQLLQHKVAYGTADMRQGPAMTPQQATAALEVGAKVAQAAIDKGAKVLIAGDMGIGNTTAATALLCRLTAESPEVLTGDGTGVDARGLARKIEAINVSLQRHAHGQNPLNTLSTLGGLEIAAMCGAYLQAANQSTVIVLDGFVSHAAALMAMQFNPKVAQYMVASCGSRQHPKRLHMLGVKPLLGFSVRLGEGAGALLALPLVRSAAHMLSHMATFEQAAVATKK